MKYYKFSLPKIFLFRFRMCKNQEFFLLKIPSKKFFESESKRTKHTQISQSFRKTRDPFVLKISIRKYSSLKLKLEVLSFLLSKLNSK